MRINPTTNVNKYLGADITFLACFLEDFEINNLILIHVNYWNLDFFQTFIQFYINFFALHQDENYPFFV